MITNVTERYIEEIEAYSIRFKLFDVYNVYWEVYWNEEIIEHVISVYKNKQHQLGVSGSKTYVKNMMLKWIDEIIKIG